MMEMHDRLKFSREQAGFATAAEAAVRFGWNYATYSAHENGHRGIKLPRLTLYSRAFKIPLAWLMTGQTEGAHSQLKDRAPKSTAPAITGFSEFHVAPYEAATDRERTGIGKLAAILAPSTPRPALHKLMHNYLEFGLLSGDILIVDLKEPPRSGQVVIVSIANQSDGSGRQILRRQCGTHLAPPLGENTTIGPDDVYVTIATVVASMRPAVA